jgi:hypothetical protein
VIVYGTRSVHGVSEGSRDASVVSTPIHNIQPHSTLRRNSRTLLSASSPGLPSPHYSLAFLITSHYRIHRCAAIHARIRLCLRSHRSLQFALLCSPHCQLPSHTTLRCHSRSLRHLENRRRLSRRSAPWNSGLHHSPTLSADDLNHTLSKTYIASPLFNHASP